MWSVTEKRFLARAAIFCLVLALLFACTWIRQGTPPKFGKFDWRDPLDLRSQLTDEERHVQVGNAERVLNALIVV